MPFREPGYLARCAAELQIFGGWRIGKGIYRFDPDLAAALMGTEIKGDVPADALRRLPEWCVYVETPGLETGIVGGGMAPVHGVFATLDQHSDGRGLLALGVDAGGARLAITHLYLGMSVEESLSRMNRQWLDDFRSGIATEWHAGQAKAAMGLFPKVLPLLLYLCSEAPDITGDGRPGNPAPKRTRDGWRLFAADKTRTWGVGVRLGAALRKAQEQAREPGPGTGSHASPRGHVRRAHWHTFRHGPGRSETRLRWLPPIPVNLDGDDEGPAVVHPVE